jgi:Tol biopolymer transport system component
VGNRVAWSPNGEYLGVGSDSTPPLFFYKREGTAFTKLLDPSTVPPGLVRDIEWSPCGRFVAIAHDNGNHLAIYEQTEIDTFTRLPDPASLPPSGANSGRGVSWTPDSNYLAFATGNQLFVYSRSNTTFTKLPNPSSQPSGSKAAGWSPNGKFLAGAFSGSPYLAIYEREDDNFTLLTNPTTFPANQANELEFSPDQQFLAVAHAGGSNISIYQTPATLPDSGVVKIIGQPLAGS